MHLTHVTQIVLFLFKKTNYHFRTTTHTLQIILFFFKKIHADMPPRDRPRVHFFDPHFFSRLAGARAQGGAARVKAATGINYEAVSGMGCSAVVVVVWWW